MGKQKRTRPHHPKSSLLLPPPPPPPHSESMPCSSNVVSPAKEKSLVLVDTERDPFASAMDVTESSMKLPHSHPSLSPHHYNLSRSMFLKRSRHYYGHQYYRRKSVNYASPSTSQGKGTALREERLSFKLANRCNSHNGCNADKREKAFGSPEIIRSCCSVKDAISSDVAKILCGICQKLLKRKPNSPGSVLSSSEFSVVAVLVCGHVYHAECLEHRTCHEHRTDPLCPMCIEFRTEGDSSRGQE